MDSAWLLRITRNACLTRLRSSGRRARFEHVDDFARVEETVPAPDHSADALIGLADALTSLPEQQRQAILLREWQGLSHSEIAQRLGLTRAAAETLVFRARRSLAAALENPAKRGRLRSLHALDLGGLLAAIKGFFAGTAGVKTVAAVLIAAATSVTVVATDPAGVWRDRPEPVTAPAAERSSRPAPALRTAREAQAWVSADAAERGAPGPGEAATHLDERRSARGQATAAPASANAHKGTGKTFGQSTADAAKAKDHRGTGKALGHSRKAAVAPRSSNGRGTPAGARPNAVGRAGPPPHAPANTHPKGKAAKASGSD